MSEQARKVKHEAIPQWAEGFYYNKGIFDEAVVYYDDEALYFEVRGKDSGIVRFSFAKEGGDSGPEGEGAGGSARRGCGNARPVGSARGLDEDRARLRDRPDAGGGAHGGSRALGRLVACSAACPDRGSALRLRHGNRNGLRLLASGTGRSYGGSRRGRSAGAACLGRGVGQLAAAHRCPPSALDPAHAQGPAPRVGPRGVRGRVGASVLGARWTREARLDKGRA